MSEGKKKPPCSAIDACLTRREFLLAGTSSVITILLSSLPGMTHAEGEIKMRLTGYPRKRIGRVSALLSGQPLDFMYPYDHPNCAFMAVRMGQEAAGGVGPEKDIVAFSKLCTHMGGSLDGQYKHEFAALGPCPMHLTVFDLRRHGMVATGHATQSLPQAILEIEGDELYAVGVLGLIFGFNTHAEKPL